MRGEANLILPEISSILFIICNVSYQSNSGFNCDPGCSFWIYKTNKGRDKSLAFFLSFLRMVFNQLDQIMRIHHVTSSRLMKCNLLSAEWKPASANPRFEPRSRVTCRRVVIPGTTISSCSSASSSSALTRCIMRTILSTPPFDTNRCLLDHELHVKLDRIPA